VLVGLPALHVAKSKYDPPSLAPKRLVVKKEPWDGAFKTTIELVTAKAKRFLHRK
jgi:hypothetical protein